VSLGFIVGGIVAFPLLVWLVERYSILAIALLLLCVGILF